MTLHIVIYAIPRPEHAVWGLWCEHCLKPSGYDMPVDRISLDGVTPCFMRMRKCYDCERPLTEVST